MGPETSQMNYKGFPKYEENAEAFLQALTQLCPQAVQDRSLTIVSDF